MNKEDELRYLYNEQVKENIVKSIKDSKKKSSKTAPKKATGESTKRSLTKTLSWEFVHLVIIAGVIYVVTGEWEYATLGALIYIAWEALAYFIHERIWAKFVKIK